MKGIWVKKSNIKDWSVYRTTTAHSSFKRFVFHLFLSFFQITDLLYKDERFSKGSSKPAGKKTIIHNVLN